MALAPSGEQFGIGHGEPCESMTAPSNALATGDGVIRLEPGERTVSRWGVRLI